MDTNNNTPRFATLQGISEDMVSEHSSVYLEAYRVLESILSEKQSTIVYGKVIAAVMIAHRREQEVFFDMIARTDSIISARWLGRRVPCATLRKKAKQTKEQAKIAVLSQELKKIEDI